MATGNIKGGKRNYARPTTPTTVTATASTTATEATVSYTPSTVGPAATSYVITGTSTNGGTTTTTISTSQSSSTVTGLSGNKSYTFGSNFWCCIISNNS
jgi:cytoskeletal protein RodZ